MSAATNTVGTLSAAALAWVREHAGKDRFAMGATVVRRGDPGKVLHVIVEGAVAVRLRSPAGVELTLATLGPGEFFGEMALLTGEPISADVVASTPTSVLSLDAAGFRNGLAACIALRDDVLASLAARVRDANRGAWDLFQKTETLRALMRRGESVEPVVAESPGMRRVLREVDELRGDDGPVAIVGEPGTGRAFIARVLHERCRGAERPLIELDCAELREDDAVALVLGAGEAGGDSAGVRIGALQLATGGSLLLRHLEALPPTVQTALAERIAGRTMRGGDGPPPRLMVTVGQAPDRLEAAGALDEALAGLIGHRVLRMPRLADRRRDILPLVEQFLGVGEGRAAPLPTDAAHAFMDRRYGHRNVAELRESVELAAVFAAGGEIRPEHVFTGPKSEASPTEAELSGLRVVRRLLAGRGLVALRAVVLASFAVVIGLCLAVPATKWGQIANALVWGAWEPALIVAFLGIGRVWCTVCPLSSAGLAAKRLAALERRVPSWLRRSGVWLAAGGFFAIVWSERVFHMISAPRASGLMLLALVLLAVSFSMLWEREAWCAHVCPLGALGAGFSVPAVLHVRANPSVCATYCATHPCFKGEGGRGGCTVFHHPLYASEGHQCKLCLACLQVCPHGSAKLYVRPPLQAVWRLGGLSSGLAPFALAVAAFAPVMLASQRSGSWVSGALGFTVAGIVAIAVGALVSVRLPRWLADAGEADDARAAQVAFAFLVLGWGPLMAYQLANLPGLAGVVLLARAGTPLDGVLPAGGVPALALVQLGVVLVAAVLAAVCLWRIRARETRLGAPPPAARWRAVLAGAGIYLGLVLGVVAAGL